jgi:hypothetical protein
VPGVGRAGRGSLDHSRSEQVTVERGLRHLGRQIGQEGRG